ncbi:conserved Plasmodium protein, unknown function [Plasmodium sp. gorilla clade G3]|nr:conserved Plasmodium protein, unknown function [Plasmodium sp. gorilla clade G3]
MKKKGNLQEFFFSVINYTFLFKKNFYSSINNISDKNRFYFRIYIKDFSASYSTVNDNSLWVNNLRVTNKYLAKKRYMNEMNHTILFCRTNENNYSILADVLIKDKTNENVKMKNDEDIKIAINEEKEKEKEIKTHKKKLIKEKEKINKKVKKEVKKNLQFVENKTLRPLREEANNMNTILDEKNNKKKKKKKYKINVMSDIKENIQVDKKKDISISDEISSVTIYSADMKEDVNNNINRNKTDIIINNDNKVVCSDILLNKEQISNNITKEKKKEKMKKRKETKAKQNNVLNKNTNEKYVNTNNVLNNHENVIINNNFNKEEYFKEFEQIGIKNNIIIKKINTIEDINKFVTKYESSLGYCNIYAYNNLLYEIYDKFSNCDIKKVKKLIKNYNKLTKKNFQKKIKCFESFYELCPTKYNEVLTCLFIQSVDILKAEDISNTFYFDNILNINKEENEHEHENENIDVGRECITTSEKVNYDYHNYDYEITEEGEKRKTHNVNYRKNEGYIHNKIAYDIDVKFINKNEPNHINENNFIIVYDLPILSYDLLTKELKETFSFCGKIKAIEFFSDRLKTVDMNVINNENESKDVGTVNSSKNNCKSKNRATNNGRKKGNQKGKDIKFDNTDQNNDDNNNKNDDNNNNKNDDDNNNNNKNDDDNNNNNNNNNNDNNNNNNNNNKNNKNNNNNNNDNKQKVDNICNYNIHTKNPQNDNINKKNEKIKKKGPQKINKIVNPNQSTQLYGIIEFYDAKSADMATSDFLRIFGIFCYNKLIYVDKCVNKNIMIITHLPFHLNIYNILYLLLNASLYNFDISHIKEEEKLNSKKYDMIKNVEGIINSMCSSEENIINDNNKFISNEMLEIIDNKVLLKENNKKPEQKYIYNNSSSLENKFDSFCQNQKEMNLINTDTEKDNHIINNIMSNNKKCVNEATKMCSFVLRNSNIKIENNDSHFKDIYKNSTDIYNYIYEISKINFKNFEEKINRHLQTNISLNNNSNKKKSYESFVDFYQNKNKRMITRKVHINNNGRTLILHFDNFTNLFECLKKFKYIFKNKNYMIFSLNLKRCIFFNGEIKDHVHIQNQRRKIGINIDE